MNVLRRWRSFDYLLLLAAIGLVLFGLILINSATLDLRDLNPSLLDTFVVRQAVYFAAGLILLFLVAGLDYRWLRPVALPLYVAILLLLVAVILVGDDNFGSRRWLGLAFFQFQPSELAKLLFIVFLAKFLSDNEDHARSVRLFGVSVALLVVPIGLIYFQPDLGTVTMFVIAWAGMMLVAGARLTFLGGLGSMAAVALPIVYTFGPAYQRNRISTFLNPLADPTGAGYNVLQAETAIGSGGLLGKGLEQGSQTQLNFLRVQQTDFIFSVLGEELGFVGAVLLFALFLIILLRGLNIAANASDSFGRLIATGIVLMILTQMFVNVGVNVRLLPVTGIPLPFVSYGGSSLLTMMLALGLLQSIALRRPRKESKWSAAKGLNP
jgi:rod shape determining protein RodA